MSTEWQSYQEACANFFRKLGLKAIVENVLEGARGKHKVDIYVEGSYLGIPFKWVVECKAWNTNVPKEKVMALASIVQDVGADRGFLLSETGFQSGAIRAAHKTNITLSSLDDLAVSTDEHFVDTVIGGLHWRINKARNRLRKIKKEHYDDDLMPPTIRPLANLYILEDALQDALKREYPVIYSVIDDTKHYAKSLEELMKAADEIISEAENWQRP